ncbi:hypothetical protein WOLCODRAFT_158346 [Wolfiporia cocos MD-104 SS10]|uniref:Uncharacterized protein n=1 Tax=Wolfiporia cocos (strain MD-104) TaxID=742152 RepID=A0A2H3J998_WOLCO|nr:hypothetical protein WOLCODRAFT_158346 [Wolfiporia cocos MD-104 SS10]
MTYTHVHSQSNNPDSGLVAPRGGLAAPTNASASPDAPAYRLDIAEDEDRRCDQRVWVERRGNRTTLFPRTIDVISRQTEQ